MTLVQKIKGSSSKWIKTKDKNLENFYWQNGYGAFSVTSNLVNNVINYIKNQHQYHSKISFQNEYRGILNKFDVEYDERYVWD